MLLPAVQVKGDRADRGGRPEAGDVVRLEFLAAGTASRRVPGGGGAFERAAAAGGASAGRVSGAAGRQSLGCRAQYCHRRGLPLPATRPDCGPDVLASTDIAGEAQSSLPFDLVRIQRTER